MEIWELEAKRLLKAELKRHGISYKVLAAKLAEIGVEETSASIASKLYRGKYPMSFFLQCMKVLEIKTVTLAK